MSTAQLLQLPQELRDQIWNLAFANQVVTPFARPNRDWFFFPVRQQCHACPSPSSDDTPASQEVVAPLLACKQMYDEASAVLTRSLCLHVTKPGVLEDIRLSSPKRTLRTKLQRLRLVIHFNDDNRDHWMAELRNLTRTFPQLRQLTVHNHMRPPISYQNLVDAIYLAGPVVHLPPAPSGKPIETKILFAYTEDDVMFSSEDLGEIWYHDALEAHESVVRSLLADPEFKDQSRNYDLAMMTGRLLDIAQSHEEPWLETLRRRRAQRQDDGAEAEAMAQAPAESEAGPELDGWNEL